MSLHLHPTDPQPVPSQANAIDAVFLVVQRTNGHWSVGAKIIEVTDSEVIAEAMSAMHKRQHPQQTFGVFMLRSEARSAQNPVEIVRVGGTDNA